MPRRRSRKSYSPSKRMRNSARRSKRSFTARRGTRQAAVRARGASQARTVRIVIEQPNASGLHTKMAVKPNPSPRSVF